MKSKSKKAVGENIETEMEAGKPHKQSIAIALSVQRQAKKKKKMAQGGIAEDINDSKMLGQNRGKKAPGDDSWTDNRSDAHNSASAAPSVPKSVRPDPLKEREMDLMNSARTKYAQGGMASASPDESDPHTGETKEDMMRRHAMELAAYADGGEVEEDDRAPSSMADQIMNKRSKKLDFNENNEGYHMDTYDMRNKDADSYADGGMVDLEENSEESPNMADQYNWEANGKEQYDDSQISKQPQGSNEHGDDIDSDIHDMVDAIRKKLKAKREA